MGAVLLLLGLVLLFLWPAALGGKALLPADNLFTSPPWDSLAPAYGVTTPHNELINDMLLQNLPWRLFAAESLSQGQLPLWNPYIFCGTPFLAAGQQAVLYPLGAIFYLLPVPLAYGWFAALHLFLGGLFMYLYLRMLKAGRFGALVAAITFAFGGFMWVSLVWPMVVSTMVWLPLLLCAIEGFLRGFPSRRSLLWWLAGALAMGLMLLAGHMEYAFYVLFTIMLYAAFRLLSMLREARRLRRTVAAGAALLAMAFLGFGLAAAQLLPFLELMGQNYRAGMTSYEQVIGWALPKRQLLAFFMPDVFGNPTHHSYFDLIDGTLKAVVGAKDAAGFPSSYPFWGVKNYVEGTAYLGILPLLLAVVAVIRRRDAHTWFFLAYALFSLALAFGLPLYRIFFYGVPGFDQLHTPFRWLFPYSVCISVLAGLGAAAAAASKTGSSSTETSERGRRLVFDIGLAAAAAGAILLTIGALSRLLLPRAIALAQELMARSQVLPLAFPSAAMLYSYQLRNIVFLGLFLLSSGLAVYGLGRRPRRRLIPVLALAVLVADLFTFGYGFNSRTDAGLLDATPEALRFLQTDPELFRIVTYNYDDTLKPNLGMLARLQDARGHDSIILARYPQFWALMERPQGLLYNQINKLVEPASLSSPLLDLMGVKYILTTGNIGLPNYTEVYRGEVNIYRNDDALPRAFAVFSEQQATSPEEALATLADPSFDPRRRVVLEEVEGPPLPGQDADARASVTVSRYTPNEVTIAAKMPQEGYLVLIDSYFPGWEARIDGVAVPILRADYIFRAVRLSAGEHQVVFRYSPWSFRLGLYVSFLSAVVLLLAFTYWGWRAVFRETEEASTVRRVARNSLAPIATQLLNRLLDFGFAIVMLRILGPENAGKFAFAVVLIGYFAIFTDFGLGTLLTRDVARDRTAAQTQRYLANTVLLRLLLCLASTPLLLGILALYAWRFNLAGDTAITVLLFGVSIIPTSFSSALAAVFNAYERMEYPAIVTVITTIARVSLGVLVLLLGWGIIGLGLVSVAANLVTATILYALLHTTLLRPRVEANLALQRHMLSESAPLMINNFLATIFFRIDVMLLQPMKGDLIVGWYTTAYKFIDGLNIIPAFFTMAIFPIMSRYAATSQEALIRAFTLALRALLIVAFPVAVGTTLIADQLILLCFGSEYAPAIIALQVLIWFLPLSYVNSVTQYVLIAVNQQRFLTLAFVIGAAFNIGANLLVIPSFGYLGASAVTVLSEVVLLVPFWYAVQRHVGDVPLLKLALRPAIAAAVMGLLLLPLQHLHLLAIIVIGAAIYAAVLVLLGTVTREDVVLLRQIWAQ